MNFMNFKNITKTEILHLIVKIHASVLGKLLDSAKWCKGVASTTTRDI